MLVPCLSLLHSITEEHRILLPSTITALRTSRYTSTLYIHRTIHGVGYNPMNNGGRYSI